MKSRNRILIIISSLILGSTLFFVIKINEEMKLIRAEWEKVFTERKSFFRERSFSGKVIKKENYGNTFIPYSLTIELDSNTIVPSWGEQFYYQYTFDPEANTLLFTVPEFIYKNATINSKIMKKEKSDSIYMNGKVYLLLSSKPFEWVPL